MPVERLPVQTHDVEHFVPAAMSAAALLPQTKFGSQPRGVMWTGDRLSRLFASQFLVNLTFAVAIWMSLGIQRLPQALLCGILAGVMRFVPYLGVGTAALFAALLALAVDPGWSLALGTLALRSAGRLAGRAAG